MSFTNPIRFTQEDCEAACKTWSKDFNCGPSAICAVLDLTPAEVRAHMGDFDQKGYTNPTLMNEVLGRLGAKFKQVYRSDEPHTALPRLRHGVIRIQWSGPWTKPGVPMQVRYRQTHWIASRNHSREIFDVNALQFHGEMLEHNRSLDMATGWMAYNDWSKYLAPWLMRQIPKCDGLWWPTHAIEVEK